MIRLTAALTWLVMLMATATAAAQATRQAAPRETDPIAALTVEFRALRAELAETTRTSLRLQLLVARVQAQEQRIIYLDRQRADAAARRSSAELGRDAVAAQMQQFNGGEPAKLTAEDRRQFEFMVQQQKNALTMQERTVQKAQVEENHALSALAQEQGRWSDLNARLDELERSLAR